MGSQRGKKDNKMLWFAIIGCCGLTLLIGIILLILFLAGVMGGNRNQPGNVYAGGQPQYGQPVQYAQPQYQQPVYRQHPGYVQHPQNMQGQPQSSTSQKVTAGAAVVGAGALTAI